MDESELSDLKRLRRTSTDSSQESGAVKRRKTVSPIKSKPFDALEQCRKLCVEFCTDKKHFRYAQFFLHPVDPVALQCPHYFDIIKHPMDLSTIQQKFNNNEYKSEDDFAFDVRLMFENCYLFNGHDHQIAPYCQLFQEVFEQRFSRIKKFQEKAKYTIFDKLNQKERFILDEIVRYEDVLAELREQLEGIKEQRMEEEAKLKESGENVKPKEKSQKKFKPKAKPIKAVCDLPQKIKKSSSKEVQKQKKPKPLPKPGPKFSKIPPQIETTPNTVKSDSEEEDTAQSMTYEEMRNLTVDINKLPQDLLAPLLEILKKYEPNGANTNDNELEIDFQSLKPITLRAMEKFVNEVKKPKKPPAIKPPMKGKTMQVSPSELDKQRKDLENQLRTIDDQLGMGPKKPAAPAPPKQSTESSSSDSDSDGSSSSSSSSSSGPSSESLASSSSESD